MGLFTGCSSFTTLKDSTDSIKSSLVQKTIEAKINYTLSAEWVKDSLANENTGFRKINRMSPLMYKNQLIVGNSMDGLVSFDLNSQKELWRINIPHGIESSGALINDRLFVGSNNGKVYSINLVNREVIWTFDTKSEMVAEPLLHDGVLFFISGNQSLFALDASTGKQLWTYNRQDTANLMTIRGGSKPAFSEGFIYAGFSDGSLVSLNAKTGSSQWEITLNKNTRFKDIDANPVIDGDSIYINSYDDKIYCISKDKGQIIWKAPYGGYSNPVIFGSSIFVSSSKGDLVSLSKKEGQLNWSKKTSQGIFSDISMYNGLLLIGESQGKLLLIDSLTGKQKASFEPGRGVFSKATLLSEKSMAYFISGEANIYGIKIQENKEE